MKRITKVGAAAEQPKRKLRVAAYARVSTGSEEQLLSLETQKAHYENLIKENAEWEYAGMFYDEGISGTKVGRRAGLLELLNQCEKGRIDRIITKSISRFARNTKDCLEMVRRLGELGITIYFEKENIDTGSMESELMLTILSGIAESESVSISENEKWSIQKRFRDGTFISVSTPYGYVNADGEMAVVPEEAEVVRRIFKEALNGCGAYIIAKGLNADNIRTRKGKRWSDAAVNGILANEKYIGDALFQKTYTDKNFNRHANHGEIDMYYVEDHHEAIISREDFDKVQALVKKHSEEKGIVKGTGIYNQRYAFSGKIVCGQCGGHFKRKVIRRNSGTVIDWACSRHIKDKDACGMLSIRDDDIRSAFIVMAGKLKTAGRQMLVPLIRSLENFDEEDMLLKLHKINEAIDENHRRGDVLTELMTAEIIEPVVFADERNLLAVERSNLEEQKNMLTSSIGNHEKELSECMLLLDRLKHIRITSEFNEKLFTEIIEKIIVNSREEITFSLKCGLRLKERLVK